MRILVIGRGGREHALVWALAKSPKVREIYCAPGNAGIAGLAQCVSIDEHQFDELSSFAEEKAIDLVVVGPEDPLFAGIVDHFESKGIAVFGPRQNAAILEGSKVFAKNLLKKYNIPTAAYESFERYDEALDYVRKQGAPIVIKADGLAAGKGVTVAMTLEEAEAALRDMMVDQVFGGAGSKVVIEEFLQGEEMTILSFVDGHVVRPMAPSQDHKPVFDNDEGPNTGGMGTYSPVPHIPQSVVDEAIRTIVQPAADAMVQEGRPFRGILYAGLMITENGPKTIEFNCRFGDPETQVVLPRLETDLVDIMLATVQGTLQHIELEWKDEAAVCVVLASGGYPGSYKKGLPISGLDQVEKSLVFHAGTKFADSDRPTKDTLGADAEASAGTQVLTNGGRVMGVTGIGADLQAARDIVYADLQRIHFEGMHYRTDIAMKAMRGHQR